MTHLGASTAFLLVLILSLSFSIKGDFLRPKSFKQEASFQQAPVNPSGHSASFHSSGVLEVENEDDRQEKDDNPKERILSDHHFFCFHRIGNISPNPSYTLYFPGPAIYILEGQLRL